MRGDAPAGWEPIEVVRSDGLGSWSVVERGGSYRRAAERAMLWRSREATMGAELQLTEESWIAERLDPPFQRVLAHGLSPRPFLLVERVRGVTGRQLLQRGPVALGQALRIGVLLCRALTQLESLTNPAGAPLPVRGTGLGLDDLWLTEQGPRLRNALRTAKMLSRARVSPEDLDLLPPEQLRGAPPKEPERDVYTAAMTVLSLLSGGSPLKRDSPRATLEAVVSPERDLPLAGLPESLTATLLRALDPNPNERPPSAEALEAEWLDAARADNIEIATGVDYPDGLAPDWLWF